MRIRIDSLPLTSKQQSWNQLPFHLSPVRYTHGVFPKQVMISLCFPSSDFPSVKTVSFTPKQRCKALSWVWSLDTSTFSTEKKIPPPTYPLTLAAEAKHWRCKSCSNSVSSSCPGAETPILRTKSVIHKVQTWFLKGGHEVAQLLICPEISYSGNKYSMLPLALDDFLHKEGTTRPNTKNNCG